MLHNPKIERYRKLRANLAALRTAYRLTRSEMAERTGITTDRLREIETRPGRIPRPEEVAELARLFHTSPEQLLDADLRGIVAPKRAGNRELLRRALDRLDAEDAPRDAA